MPYKDRAEYLAYQLDYSKKNTKATVARNSVWRKKNRKRYLIAHSAHMFVQRAIKTAQLVKRPCEVCGSTQVQAHHDDYGKPLDVRWLCSVHHRCLHANRRV